MQKSAAAIITAGGIGCRMGGKEPKQFLQLHGRPILARTLTTFDQTGLFAEIILVIPATHQQQAAIMLKDYGLTTSCRLTTGGQTRQDSVKAGLDCLAESSKYVLVHDGVRPLAGAGLIRRCLEEIKDKGAAIAATPVRDTIKSVNGSLISKTVDRSNLWLAQTPQGAKTSLLRQAYARAAELNFTGTDEASLLELINFPVAVVAGSETNIKITVPEDISKAEAIMQETNRQCRFRTGHGYDAHRLVEGRPLVLGGVTIPHKTGLLGHSDADVLTHALCDALLGATGNGDLGRHFPDNDQQFKDIDSLKLLNQVVELTGKQGFSLINADITVIAQQPKLATYLAQMQKNLATTCQVSESSINVKATTTEQMGFTGREEGLACHAIVLVEAGEV